MSLALPPVFSLFPLSCLIPPLFSCSPSIISSPHLCHERNISETVRTANRVLNLSTSFLFERLYMKASIRWQDSAPSISGYWPTSEPHYAAKCVQRRCFQCGSVSLRSDIKGTELPPVNILIPLERQLIAIQLCRWEFLYNETLQQIFRSLLSKLSKRRQI